MASPSTQPELGAAGRDGRKLIAVVYADMVGYSRLIGVDDLGTILRLRSIRRTVVDPAVEQNGGTVVQTGGDSLLIVFDSIAGAVRCAVGIQTDMREQNQADPPDSHIRFRIGINIGDVIAEGTDVHGDSVNVAARLQEVCPAGGICVSRAVYEQVGSRLNVDFQPMGALELKNISRRIDAYAVRFDPVAVVPVRGAIVSPAVTTAKADRPSIAVLPFANTGGDPEDEYFSEGMAEDIITELSRSRLLFVIARNSSFAFKKNSSSIFKKNPSFTFKDEPFDRRQVADELGVRYLHVGSVRRAGERIRVGAQLIDAETGNQLWGERYDRGIADLFAVQDEIANAIAATIQPVLSLAEQRRAMRRPPDSLSAWETYQRGVWHRAKGDGGENALARNLFQRAAELDPTFARPLQGIAQSYFDDAHLFLTRPFADAARLAEPFARKAVLLDPNDAEAYVALALVSAAEGDLATELTRVERALSVNPNCAAAYGILGQCLVFSGRYDEGCRAIMMYLRRNPCDPRVGPALHGLAVGRYLMGEYAAAADLAMRAVAVQPGLRDIRRWLIAALGQLGRKDEAQNVMRQSAAVLAPVTFDEYARRRLPWVREEDQACLIDGLRKAGWQA